MNNPAEAPHYPNIAFFQPVKGVLHPPLDTETPEPLEHK
jgi:hypothetical protein